MSRKIIGVHSAPRPHWVGDGFPVRSLFSHNGGQTDLLSPFLLLDHAGPARFEPATQPRGVGSHPHRGFETVTIVYEGEVAHRDSTGAGGVIGAGDVQWMTAASGILHEEFHSPEFTKKGGELHMMQLWVNLPAADKMSPPRYQTLLNQDIARVRLPGDAGELRVIAGAYGSAAGAARTFTPVDVFDVRLNAGARVSLPTHADHNLILVVARGTVMLNGSELVREGQWVQFDREGGDVQIEANNDAMLLWLSGAPIDEPVVGYGPFVMNTEAEIRQAITDFNTGKFGRIALAGATGA